MKTIDKLDVVKTVGRVTELGMQTIFEQYNYLTFELRIVHDESGVKLNSDLSPLNLEYLFAFLSV